MRFAIIFFLIIFSTTTFAGTGFWLRGQDFTNFIAGSKANFMTQTPPNLSSADSVFEPDLNSVIGEWYTSSFRSTVQMHTGVSFWLNGISPMDAEIEWELYDFNPLNQRSTLIARGTVSPSNNENYVALAEPYSLDPGRRLRVVLKGSGKIALDKTDLSSKSEWVSKTNEVFSAPGIQKTGLIYFESCSFEEVACTSNLSCNDSNPFTQDTCINVGACEAYCEYDSCSPSCTSPLDCQDGNPLTIDWCVNAGSCDGYCTNNACEVQCDSQQDCNDKNPGTTDVCNFPGTCFSSCENIPVAEKTITQESCRIFECSGNNCTETLAINCCGNNLCEQGETCAADCIGVNLEVLSPLIGDYVVLGEEFFVVVKNPVKTPLLVNGFFGKHNLLDDGQHNDELPNDGIYGLNFKVSENETPGIKTIAVEDKQSGKTIFFHLNVIPVLEVSLQEGKKEYILSDVLEVSGNVSKKSRPLQKDVYITGMASGKTIFSNKVPSDAYGNFYFSYKSLSTDPAGDWIVEATVSDGFGNKGKKSVSIVFFEPEQDLPLKLKLVDGFNGNTTAGGKISARLVVTKNSIPLDGAVLSTKIKAKDIELVPEGNGVYFLETVLPGDLSAGRFSVVVRAEKGVDFGQKVINFELMPREIIVDIKPDKESFLVGETSEIEVGVSFKNGDKIDGVNIEVKVGGQPVQVIEKEGSFFVFYKVEEATQFNVEVIVTAPSGSTGSGTFTGLIEGYSIWYYLETYAILITAILVIFLGLVSFIGYAKYEAETKNNLERREEELLKEIKYLQTRYFKLGTITRKKYDELILKYEQELNIIRKKLGKANK